MTTLQLSLGRHHLDQNRRMIVARSIASALAGIVPIPGLDDWLSSRMRRGTLRRIALMRGVDVDHAAVTALRSLWICSCVTPHRFTFSSSW